MYKACIFDLDGTLTDTLDSIAFSVDGTLKEMQLPQITKEQCRQFVGDGARVLMMRALEAAGGDVSARIDEAMRIYGRIFDENCTYHVVPYEGIPEVLSILRKRGIKLAVLSNKPHKQTVHVVETVFGKDTFQWIQGQKEGVPRKPDPTAALQIAKEFHAEASEAVYVGDSEVDIATGTAACMKTIGVSWGFRGHAALSEAGAGLIAGSPEDLLKLINE